MTTYQTPGVYVVEDDSVPIVLTGVPTGIPCFFGFTEQGPSGAPIRIASLNEFYSVFGRRASESVFPNQYMVDAVHGFFLNGGNVCYVCRVNEGNTAKWPIRWIENVADLAAINDETQANVTPDKPKLANFNVEVISPGTWGNSIRVVCRAADDTGLPPLHQTHKVVIDPKTATKAEAVVALHQLDASGALGLPTSDALDAQSGVTLVLGDPATAQPMAWTAGSGFKGTPPLDRTDGQIVITPDVKVDVVYQPDNALAPELLSSPELKVTDELKKQWDFRTTLTFQVEDGSDVFDLTAKWSSEEQVFFVSRKSGAAYALKGRPQIKIEEATLTAPIDLKGKGIRFDLVVNKLIPGSAPGAPPTAKTLETFGGLSTNPNDPSYYLRDGVVNGSSSYVKLEPYDSAVAPDIGFGDTQGTMSPPADAKEFKPTDKMGAPPAKSDQGSDKQPLPTDYEAFFNSLKGNTDVSIIACPDAYPKGDRTPESTYQTIFQAAIAYASAHRCMVVIDTKPEDPKNVKTTAAGMTKVAGNQKKFADAYRSSYAAIYTPWVTTANLDPASPKRTKLIPPSGLIIGAYNRSDAGDGVWKAPANMPLLGPIDLQFPYTDEQNDVLNPAGVNVIRNFPGHGILIWGARTTSTEVMWQYVNVRRIFLYVERTLKQQMMAAVFESNDEKTWNSIVHTVEAFLREFWQSGGLMGTTPQEAFRVQCGMPQTMTPEDVAAGMLKVQIAIAPVKPAEFVIFTISQLIENAASGS